MVWFEGLIPNWTELRPWKMERCVCVRGLKVYTFCVVWSEGLIPNWTTLRHWKMDRWVCVHGLKVFTFCMVWFEGLIPNWTTLRPWNLKSGVCFCSVIAGRSACCVWGECPCAGHFCFIGHCMMMTGVRGWLIKRRSWTEKSSAHRSSPVRYTVKPHLFFLF